MFRNNKKFKVVLACLLMAILLVPTMAMPLTAGASSDQIYIVQSGDNLSKIAKKFYDDASKWKLVCDANGLTNCNLIWVGQTLIIPANMGTTQGNVSDANAYEQTHRARLEQLDPTFRANGIDAWRQVAGMKGQFNYIFAPTEETWSGRQWVSGFVANVTNADIGWPNGMTTNLATPVNGRCITVGPDSKLCTDVQGFTGKGTFYGSAYNWGQLWPAAPAPTLDCPTAPADLENWGTVLQWLRDADNNVAGAQLDGLTAAKIAQLEQCGLIVQGTNPTVRSVWLW